MAGRNRKRVTWCCQCCGKQKETTPSQAGITCSKSCAMKLRPKKLSAPRIPCAGCGMEFSARMSGGQRMRYCSRRCVDEHSKRITAECVVLRAWGGRNRPIAAKTCPVCGDFSIRDSIFCCDSHKRAHTKAQAAQWFQARKAYRTVDALPCACCGQAFTPAHLAAIYCSKRCSNRMARQFSASRAKRRAVMKGAGVEVFSPMLVFRRDGWQCQLCGISTPQALRGTMEHNAPELDHVIPLAKGGTHAVGNCQCLCRSCNGFKSDLLVVDVMRLLAA